MGEREREGKGKKEKRRVGKGKKKRGKGGRGETSPHIHPALYLKSMLQQIRNGGNLD